jgi:trimeric autotransporter adhesin
MINERCTGGGGGGGSCSDYFCDDFEGGSLTGNNAWTIVDVLNEKGSAVWYYDTFSSDNFAESSGFSGGAKNAESWFISPAINLASSTAPKLSFSSAASFTGTDLEVYVSTSYVSGAINMGDWTQLTGFPLSTSSFTEVQSGNIDLSSYKQSGVRIAFRFRSTTAGSKTYQIDDVYIKE